MGPDRCESCGASASGTDDILNVQRVYLVASPEGTVGTLRATVHDDIEAWCFVCRTMYPHEPVHAE